MDSLTELYRKRRDTMLDALADYFPPQAEWTGRGAACSSGRCSRSSSTPPTCSRGRCATSFVPGEAAFLDGRGRSAMRLNFSGSDEEAIREGIRRIGEVVNEQVQLYGTLTGEHRAPPDTPAPRWCGCPPRRTRPQSRGS